jgi:hypothetical protein
MNSPSTRAFDVAVVGGGVAGVSAAIGAAQRGASVCLIERNGYFGGAATASSVLTYCGFFDRTVTQVVKGVGQQFLDELDAQDLYRVQTMRNSGNTVVLLDLETTKRTLDRLVLAAGVTSFLHSLVVEAGITNDRITELAFAHRGGIERIQAKAFVDASGDGALIGAAGAGELRAELGARQASTLVMRMGGVPLDASLDRGTMRSSITGYAARTGTVFERVEGTMVRLPVSDEVMLLLVDEHADVFDPSSLTQAEFDGRRLAEHYTSALREGMPGWERAYLAETGPNLGVRESLRLLGEEVLSADAVAGGVKRPDDGVARGGWPTENHIVPGRTDYTYIKDDGWFDVPYGALKSATTANLWAGGRLLSTDSQAYASTRVMGTAFATGHAAGAAAALHAERGAVDVATLRQELERQGALL